MSSLNFINKAKREYINNLNVHFLIIVNEINLFSRNVQSLNSIVTYYFDDVW